MESNSDFNIVDLKTGLETMLNPLVSKTLVEGNHHYDFCVYGNHCENSRGFDDISEEYQYLNLIRKILKKG